MNLVHRSITLPGELVDWLRQDKNRDINLSGFVAKHLYLEKQRREQ